MNWPRALAVWALIAVVETVHGVLRQLLVVPLIGDLPARQLGVVVGSLLILGVAWFTAPWLALRTPRAQLQAGALWVVLMAVFEVVLGLALGYDGSRLWADYDPSRGGYMGLGLLVLLLAPLVAARLRAGREGVQR
ncbi:MAG: hypothetical protein PHP86_01395 [Nevskiales bacterium]|nr:hypothetical protein [Nevskiales bacterium]